MAAAFTFDGYQIKSINYVYDENNEKTTGNRVLNFQISVATDNENPNRYQINLITMVQGNPIITLDLFGIFTSTGFYKEDEILESVRIVGASILYPYARSIISSISVQGGDQGIILPTINIPELFSNNEKGESGEDNIIESPNDTLPELVPQ